jgi:hypothetical protein
MKCIQNALPWPLCTCIHSINGLVQIKKKISVEKPIISTRTLLTGLLIHQLMSICRSCLNRTEIFPIHFRFNIILWKAWFCSFFIWKRFIYWKIMKKRKCGELMLIPVILSLHIFRFLFFFYCRKAIFRITLALE